jgi:drug/metabolite transporter (DMT)-like permease
VTLLWLCLGVLYVVWGSTYLAIKVAIRTIPPFSMASVRFLVAGGLLFAWAVRRGDRRSDPIGWPQWRAAAIVGGALLFGGNGGVVWAEHRGVPTGVVALIIASIPLWMALIDRLSTGQRLARPAVVGLVLGFAGLAILVGRPGGRIDGWGVAVALGAALSWSAGSVYARRAPLPSRPLVSAAMEMLVGGALLAAASIVTGEPGRIHLDAISGRSLLGLGYLIVFGSLIAFSSYAWLLSHARLSLLSTYAYVNPVVAVVLGWAVLSEAITGRMLFASAVIVAAVALIVTARTVPNGPRIEAGPCEPVVNPAPDPA